MLHLPDFACRELEVALDGSEARLVLVDRSDLSRVLNWVDAASRLLPDPLPPQPEDVW